MRRAVDKVRLALEEPDTVVELRGDSQGLVGGSVARLYERGVVGGDFGDVAVGAGAEFGVVVTGRGVDGLDGGGRRCACGVGGAVEGGVGGAGRALEDDLGGGRGGDGRSG